MRKQVLFIMSALAVFCACSLAAQQNPNPMDVIIYHYAARNFISGTIPKQDLDQIISAGVHAPSARNGQPWHFTVVQSLGLAKKMVSDTVEGNVIIVISAAGDGRNNQQAVLDCALAVQSIYLAAQMLGYGSRIYTGPMDNINKNLKEELGIPGSRSAVALIRIGKVRVEKVDAVSRASTRKKTEEVVTYK